MKLRNKKTGEIIEPCEIYCDTQDKICVRRPGENFGAYIEYEYNSLAELNSEWEDVPEEPEKYWYIEEDGDVIEMVYLEDDKFDQKRRQIGNYFETKEEAEKAVEKLKAWKRLKDKGVKIIGYYCDGGTNTKGEFSGEVNVAIDVPQEVDINLFYLLFGGEEFFGGEK